MVDATDPTSRIIYTGIYKNPRRKKLLYYYASDICDLPSLLVDGLIVYPQYGVSCTKVVKRPYGYVIE